MKSEIQNINRKKKSVSIGNALAYLTRSPPVTPGLNKEHGIATIQGPQGEIMGPFYSSNKGTLIRDEQPHRSTHCQHFQFFSYRFCLGNRKK